MPTFRNIATIDTRLWISETRIFTYCATESILVCRRVISNRTIELHCPTEWKRKTKPTRKNEKISFSKQVEDKPQHKVAVMQGSKSVTINETQEGSGGDVSSPQPGQVAETGIDISPGTSTSDSQSESSSTTTAALQQQQEKAASHNPILVTVQAVLVNNPSANLALLKMPKLS
jgi:hypothetical protein